MPDSAASTDASRPELDVSAGHDWRLGRFPNLMPRRIEQILLVSSAYDAFILEEDGLLTELIFSEYVDLGLTHAPRVIRVTNGEEALALLRQRSFDLVITMLRVGDMDVSAFSRAVRELRPALPVVLLIANELELARLGDRRAELGVDGIYVWQGDAKLFLAIIKATEDRWNVGQDTEVGGVGVIILVEDSVRYRSTLLPLMYSELVQQTRAVMTEGLNRMQKLLRLRARPKILMAETFEEGMEHYRRYQEYIFGLITDVSFARGGRQDPQAGIELIRIIREENPDLPVLLQSSDPRNRELATSLAASFLHKRSTTLLHDLREFMLRNFGFGDFVFRTADGREVARASDLRSMARVLADVPAEVLEYHARRNHFSNWLRARTEFVLARRLRPRKVSEFSNLEALRKYLIMAFDEVQRQNRRGVVEDFSRERFDPTASFARIGGGSLGGKARGLAFIDALLARHQLDRQFPDVRIFVPRSVVIGTAIFDEFLDRNRLRRPELYTADEQKLREQFLAAEFPDRVLADLRALLEIVRYPLAVRSSSLLEDSQFYPFAGVYGTYMLPNNHPDLAVRLWQLCEAIKLVFASTFFPSARQYLETTPHHLEAQKMAVIIQQAVGRPHEHYFYPDFAGVVRSYNFYPFGHMKPEDGVASVALGLGKTVVEGGEALRFSPAHPQVLPQLTDGKQFLDQSQRRFFAIDLERADCSPTAGEDAAIAELDLDTAESHGTLGAIGSVWSPENQAFYDGIHRPGVRAVTFAHVLKSDLFPLAELLRRLLELARLGLAGPVEMEFAVNLTSPRREFAVLQVRPYGAGGRYEPVDVDGIDRGELVCYSERALGNGIVDGLRDIVYVRPETFDAAETQTIARELAAFNERLRSAEREYLLIGPGRWGSTNRWLGIPVVWGQISAARVIVEASLENFIVDPSQGSHFFHNLTSLGASYLTINPRLGEGFIDWGWLEALPAEGETRFVRHVRPAEPIEARIDGRTSRGAVLKRARRQTLAGGNDG